jgi:PKD repeat protein
MRPLIPGLHGMAPNPLASDRLGHAQPSLAVPVADFTVDNASPAASATVTFTDISTNTPDRWDWDFGDGTKSTTKSPTKAYATPGPYTVRLTATNASGSHTRTQAGLMQVGGGS